MPVLFETCPATGETIELAELSVIEFYLAQKLGLLGSNAWENQLIRSYASSSFALFDKFVVTVVRSPPELKAQMMESFTSKQVGEWATFHERILQANGANGHYLGDKVLCQCQINKWGYYITERIRTDSPFSFLWEKWEIAELC